MSYKLLQISHIPANSIYAMYRADPGENYDYFRRAIDAIGVAEDENGNTEVVGLDLSEGCFNISNEDGNFVGLYKESSLAEEFPGRKIIL